MCFRQSLQKHIAKQKAEIERLRGDNENLQTANTALSNEILDIKSEARKEFWEMLKSQNTMDERIISVKSGDKLLEEMERASTKDKQSQNLI